MIVHIDVSVNQT